MKKLVVLFAVLSLAALAGCQTGPRVVDNQYRTSGFPHYTIDSEFVHLGSPNLEDTSVCVNNCQTFSSINGDVLTDLFVREIDGEIKEVVILQRDRLSGRSYWVAVKGPMSKFGGKEYGERFFSVKDEKSGGVYTAHAKSLGMVFERQPFDIRQLTRNVSDKNKIHVYYAASRGIMPEEVRGQPQKTKEFLRERFAQVITLPE